MTHIKHTHAEPKAPAPNEKKFPRKALPPDREYSSARAHMFVRRQLGKYNRIATQVNSLVDKIEAGQDATKAYAEWARDNGDSLHENVHSMLRFFVRAHDSTQSEFLKAHTNFAAFSEIMSGMSDGAHAKDPSILANAMEHGKEAARLGEILIQTRQELERRIGNLQGKIEPEN